MNSASSLFGAMPMLSLTIPGEIISGNEKTRAAAIPKKDRKTGQHVLNEKGEKTYRAIVYSTKASREFEERVRSIATYEVLKTGWIMPEWCWVEIIAYNSGMDRENISKTVCDALQGIVFANDGRILDGPITKRWDRKGMRVEVNVRAVDPRAYGR